MMIELWQLISLAITFLGVLVTLGRVLLSQIDKRLEQRFGTVEREIKTARDFTRDIEREFLHWKADLPVHYVRREDYVRNQTVIEAKLDALALRFENFHLMNPQAKVNVRQTP